MSDPSRWIEFSYDVSTDVWIPLPTDWPNPQVGTKEDWLESASRICMRHTKWWNPMGRKQWNTVLQTLIQDSPEGALSMCFVHVPSRWGRIAHAVLTFDWGDLDHPEHPDLTLEERLLIGGPAPLEAPIVTPFISPALGKGFKMSSIHPLTGSARGTQFRSITYAWSYRGVHAVLTMEDYDLKRLAEFEPDLDELARSFSVVTP